MNLSHVKFNAQAFAMGPAVGPTVNPHMHNVKQVVCRAAKTVALTEDGKVYTWGTCTNSSLGHGAGVTSTPLPRRVEALDGINIVQVRASGGDGDGCGWRTVGGTSQSRAAVW